MTESSGARRVTRRELLDIRERQWATRLRRVSLAAEAEISAAHRAQVASALGVVLNEAMIRRLVGERAVMQAQLAKLLELSGAPNVIIQVLPFSAGAHPAMDSAFSVVTFDPPAPGDVVYVEYSSGALYLEVQDDVARYRLMFGHLRAMALAPEESRRLLARSAGDLA